MSFLLGAKKEEAKKNGSICSSHDSPNQIVNSYKPLEAHSRALQAMQQRLQNYPRPFNFNTQGGKCQQNNVVDGKTQSMEPYAFFGNKNAPLLLGPGYSGGMLSLSFMTGSQEQMGHRNIPLNLLSHGDSNKNLSFNVGAGLQGTLPPLQIQNLDSRSYKDSACERVAKHLFSDRIQEINDNCASSSKKPRIISVPPVCYEEMQSSKKELLVFNKGKHAVSAINIQDDAKEKVAEKNLDLSLHL
ncbi:hypothetical protein RJT34_11170 [Clitoria ternatea]|uniref:Uncharacterized protein n=1 Tax=Clitoria ternatea TaxID=43366 RepID=A0AAN9JJK0_CLITE